MSLGEQEVLKLLIDLFGQNDVLTNYRDKRYARENGYQFRADFYIKSKDLFIELNLHPTHGTRPFDPNNEEDCKKLELLKSSESKWDHNIAMVWGGLDVEKRNIANLHNLNHRMVYSIEELKFELQC